MKKHLKTSFSLALLLSITCISSIHAKELNNEIQTEQIGQPVVDQPEIEKKIENNTVQQETVKQEKPVATKEKISDPVINGNSAYFIAESPDKLTKTKYYFVENNGNWQQTKVDVIKYKLINTNYVAQSHFVTDFTYINKNCSSFSHKPIKNSCAKKTRETSYLTADNTQLIYQSVYNGGLQSKKQWLRNNNGYLTEQRTFTYYPNGQIKQYDRRFGGRRLAKNYLSYNKTYIRNNLTNGRVSDTSSYENSLIYNGAAKTVLTNRTKYAYHKNGRVKQKNVYLKSTKYNQLTKRQFTTYFSNGKRQRLINDYYNTNGTIKNRAVYNYNRTGQLKSNRYGNATRINRAYKNKKVIKTVKYKYDARGKMKKIK